METVKTAGREDLGFALYERREDGVIVLHLENDLMIDLEKAERMNEALGRITAGIPSKILVLTGKYSSADKEARQLLSSGQKRLQIAKAGVVIHSLSQKLLANFFSNVHKPPFPVRFFNSAEDAEKWLRD
ncbi:MAG TPA: hypothetical protein VFU15_01400 [Bacteroidia bacterium]|nr:hypothetical protein [Bacteroidia bacterium]